MAIQELWRHYGYTMDKVWEKKGENNWKKRRKNKAEIDFFLPDFHAY